MTREELLNHIESRTMDIQSLLLTEGDFEEEVFECRLLEHLDDLTAAARDLRTKTWRKAQ